MALLKPILFSGPMVRAILEGRKTMTRRVLKPQPVPPASEGGKWHIFNRHGGVFCDENEVGKLRPSMFMCRWMSRITLEVTAVKVERLQDISAADSIAEGVQCDTCGAMDWSACGGKGCFASLQAFKSLWDYINGPGSWDTNPWVAAYSFERVPKP